VFWERFVELCNKAGEAPNAVAAKCGVKSTGTVTGWSNGAKPRAGVTRRIADYFSVSVDYLIGKEEKPALAEADADLMYALWGGEAHELDEEDLQDVMKYAAYVLERKRKGKK